MEYHPTIAECKHLFRFVNLIALDGLMICPKFKFSKFDKKVFGLAYVDKGTPGTIELHKTYPCYTMFVSTLVHELGHIYISRVLGKKWNVAATHGFQFKKFEKMIKKRLNNLEIREGYWATSKYDPRERTNRK